MRIEYIENKQYDYGIIEFRDMNRFQFFIKGNLKELLTWLIENKDSICNELFFYGQESKSLALRLFEARNIEFNEENMDLKVFDFWHEAIFDYYKTHGLTFGLRGFDNKDIIIGKNLNTGEFSCCEDGKEIFRYEFDLDEFYREVERIYQELINES